MNGVLVAAALAGVLCSAPALAQSGFVLGGTGCPMAHCDPTLSDQANAPVPAPPVVIAWRSATGRGSALGLGCASNGEIAACSFTGDEGDNLVVYDRDGRRLWTSGRLMGSAASWSAPIVGADGSVIAADARHLVRFGPGGDVVWRSRIPAGIPVSPVLTRGGFVVMATWNGPVIAYDARTGALVGELWLGLDPFGISFFHSTNTAAVSGDRAYVVTQRRGSNPANEGRLYAIDVTPTGLRQAWTFGFGGPSGASPTIIDDVVYFDGDRPAAGFGAPFAPTVFAVRDQGTSASLLWARPAPSGTSAVASFAVDPRGGFWMYGIGDEHLVRIDPVTGDEIERLSVDGLTGLPGRHLPSSGMTVAGSPSAPVLLVGAALELFAQPFVLAVDLEARAVLWQVALEPAPSPTGNMVRGQFAIVWKNGAPRVIFSTGRGGAVAVESVVAPR